MEHHPVVRQCQETLRKLYIPTTHLGALHKEMREKKATIDAALGLGPENFWRKIIPVDLTEEDLYAIYPVTYSAVVQTLHNAKNSGSAIDLSTLSLTENRVNLKGQPIKLSKMLAKVIEDDALKTCFNEIEVESVQQFLPKFGDLCKGNRAVVVSTNIIDILTASNFAVFRSCHSADGEYYNGNISYCRDEVTAISFVVAANEKQFEVTPKKLGRAWMYFDLPNFVQARTYGSFSKSERKAVRLAVEERLCAHTGLPNKWKVNHNRSYPYDCQGPCYIDAGSFTVAMPAGSAPGAQEPIQFFGTSKCLVCGGNTSHPERGMCSSCDDDADNYSCKKCKTPYPMCSLVDFNEGEGLCPLCAEELALERNAA